MSNKFGTKTQKGQSLLEVAITVGIAALVISAIAITTIIGLKNSEFSQNQIQATKLAQEGLEAIRSMRANDTPISDGATIYCWHNGDVSLVWGNTLTAPNYYLHLNEISSGCGGSSQLSSAPPEDIIQNKFTRTVQITDYGSPSDPKQKQFSVIVSWKDSSGTHNSTLTTILTSYQN